MTRTPIGSQVRSTSPAVPSPCISLCKMNQDTGLCDGCWRTIDEIVAWSSATDASKRTIWQNIAQRKIESGQIKPHD